MSAPATPKLDPAMIEGIRGELNRLGLDAMVVPHAGAHQSEYLPPCDERLLCLTGFSGSAGLAIVLNDRAAVFIDGRYTLQAGVEVDESVFEICPLATTPPTQWLRDQLSTGARVGYDPWHFTPISIKPYSTAMETIDGELVALDTNPIDALWLDQPAPPSSTIRAHPDAIAGMGSKAKREMIAKTLRTNGTDAQVMLNGESISWLFNIRAEDVPFSPLVLAFAVLFDDGRAELFVEPHRIDTKTVGHLGSGVEIKNPATFGAALEALGLEAKRVGIAADATPLWVVERLKAAGAKVLHGTDPCQLPKAAKNASEIQGMRDAHHRDGVALVRFLAWLSRHGGDGEVSEISAADKLETFRASFEQYRGPSFPTISGAGANGAIVHYRVNPKTNRVLKQGELYLVDSGAQYPDGTTDVTRTLFIGGESGEPTPEMKDRFTRVLKGHIAVSAQTFPQGTSGHELDVLARRALWQVGLDFDHGTGHGVGAYLSVHEGPQRISRRGDGVALKVGMVLSIEPGYYKKDAYGIRIENLVSVVESQTPKNGERQMLAFEPLTLAPIERALIDTQLLEAWEISWLDAYHARVLERLSGELSRYEQSWLKSQTAPLDRN